MRRAALISKALRQKRWRGLIWGLLVDTIQTGPMDGGCYVFAKACQKHFPDAGISVVRGHPVRYPVTRDQHYLLEFPDGSLLDADGIHTHNSFPEHYLATERIIVTEIAQIKSTEEETSSVLAVGANHDPAAISLLSELIAEILRGTKALTLSSDGKFRKKHGAEHARLIPA